MTGEYEWRGRGAEIKNWLYRYSLQYPDDEVKYVILDDLLHYDFLDEQQPYFVHTNYLYGLQDNDVEKAIKILNGDVNES